MADLSTSIRISVLDAFSAPLRKMRTGLEGLERGLRDVEKHTRIAADLNQAAEGMGRFSDATVGMLKEPLEQFAKFEHQIAKVGAVGDLSAADLGTLKQQALDLGAATRYSATEAALAQETLVSAGYAVNDIMKITPVSLELATAADLSLAQASDILTGSLGAFGLQASRAGHAADVLATGAAVSKANVEYLSEVTSKAGPIANTLSISLETVAAAGAALADGMQDASSGGTALRAMLLRLSAPAREGEKAFASLGIAGHKLKDLQNQLGSGDLTGVLQTIGQSFDRLGLTAAERLEKLKHIFGDEAATQATILIDASMRTDEHGLGKLKTAFENADGAAARMAQRMDNDTTGALSRLDSAFEGLQVTIGEQMAPTVVSASDSLGGLISVVADFAGKNPEATKASLELFGALAGLSLGLKGILIVQSAYHGGLAALGTTYTALSGSLLGSIGLVAAVGAASYAIGTWANETFGLADKISSALGRKGPEQSKDFKGQEEYADGTVLSASGDVIKLGADRTKAPKEVRDAIKAGATTEEEIGTFVRMGRTRRANADLASVANGDAMRLPTFNAVKARVEQPVMSGTERIVEALREQTQIARRSEGVTREMQRELRRRRTTAGPWAPTPIGE